MVEKLFFNFPHVPFLLEYVNFWGQDQDLRDVSDFYWYVGMSAWETLKKKSLNWEWVPILEVQTLFSSSG